MDVSASPAHGDFSNGSVHYLSAMNILLPHFQRWLRAAGRSERTIALRSYYLRRAARTIRKPIAEISTDDLLGWLADQDWQPVTRKSAVASLRLFFRWAVDFGHLDQNPAVRLPSIRVPRGTPRPAPKRELWAAMDDATDRDWLLLGLAAYAGLRRSEIAGLRWSAVDWDGLRIRGKGGTVRLIPLLPQLRNRLAAEQERRQSGTWGTGWRYRIDPASPYVFPGARGGHMSPDRVARVITKAMGHRYSPHTLRHRFASASYAVDRDLRAVQELMGHASVETTQLYTQVPGDAKRRAVAGTVDWDESA